MSQTHTVITYLDTPPYNACSVCGIVTNAVFCYQEQHYLCATGAKQSDHESISHNTMEGLLSNKWCSCVDQNK